MFSRTTGLVRTAACLTLALLAATAVPAPAAMLDLTQSYPDVYADTISISYNAGTGVFTATGTAEDNKSSSSSFTAITGGAFSITVTLSKSGSGNTAVLTPTGTSNSLRVTGSGPTTFFASSNLLAFGYSPATDDFSFLFGAPDSGTDFQGQTIGVLLEGNGSTNFTTHFFDQSFATTSLPLGTSDTFNVPEPASLALLGLALPLFLRRRKR